MRERLMPLVGAFVLFAVVFLGLDFFIMKLHGLALVYTP